MAALQRERTIALTGKRDKSSPNCSWTSASIESSITRPFWLSEGFDLAGALGARPKPTAPTNPGSDRRARKIEVVLVPLSLWAKSDETIQPLSASLRPEPEHCQQFLTTRVPRSDKCSPGVRLF